MLFRSYILENTKDIKALKPQVITNSEYYPYCMSFIVKNDGGGVLKRKIIEHLAEKDIPVSTGIPRLLCDHYCYNKKNVPGSMKKAGYIWSAYISFFQIGYPNTVADMDELISALKEATL